MPSWRSAIGLGDRAASGSSCRLFAVESLLERADRLAREISRAVDRLLRLRHLDEVLVRDRRRRPDDDQRADLDVLEDLKAPDERFIRGAGGDGDVVEEPRVVVGRADDEALPHAVLATTPADPVVRKRSPVE